VAKNLAIAIGRLALASPDAVAPLLGNFLKRFCFSIGTFEAKDIEQEQAFM